MEILLRYRPLWTDSCNACYRYMHKKFNPPVTSRWVYDRTTRNHFRERKEHASNHGKKSIDVCFHSLQKSCLLRVARYTCSRWLVLSDVTIFLAQTNVWTTPLCHITLASMTFLLLNIFASCVIDVFHITLMFNIMVGSQIKIEE